MGCRTKEDQVIESSRYPSARPSLLHDYLEIGIPPVIAARLLDLPAPGEWQDMTVAFRAYAGHDTNTKDSQS